MVEQQENSSSGNLWHKAQSWLRALSGRQKPSAPEPQDELNPCCGQPRVHIGFRGKSDDRMYMAYNREWQEVRYFQTYGLKVFCAVCRRRLL